MRESTVHHADLFGLRAGKYQWLAERALVGTEWRELQPNAPFYLFVPQDEDLRAEYAQGYEIPKIFSNTLLGPNSHRDDFAISFIEDVARERIDDLANRNFSDDELREKYDLTDNRDWKLSEARKFDFSKAKPTRCIYRPFDFRWMLYGSYAFDYPRPEINDHLVHSNFAIITTRQTKEAFSVHATNLPAGQHKLATPYDGSYLSPLYLYPTAKTDLFDDSALGKRRANLAPAFIADFSQRLIMTFVPDGQGDRVSTYGPEDVFHYAYAVFHSPEYRRRYTQFLKIDFPRLPLTSSPELFRNLCALGGKRIFPH